MDATNVVTSTDTVGIGYHQQGHPAHQRTITPVADNHRTLDTPQVDVMTEEAGADPMLGYTRETEVQVAQDTPVQTYMPAGTETQDRDTRLTATGPRAVHPTDSDQAITDHQLHTPGTTLGVDASHNNEKPHRRSVTIQDNPADNDDQEYDNVDDYFDEDLN